MCKCNPDMRMPFCGKSGCELPKQTRTCGDCQLCCKLVPVKGIGKPAGTTCTFQGAVGCKIYKDRPRECAVWSCMWLMDDSVQLERPDKSHYVIDPMRDIAALKLEDGTVEPFPTVQVWVDPKHPDAHRDPKLRAYLLTLETEGIAQIRYDESRGFVLFPPHASPTGDWLEMNGTAVPEGSLRERS